MINNINLHISLQEKCLFKVSYQIDHLYIDGEHWLVKKNLVFTMHIKKQFPNQKYIKDPNAAFHAKQLFNKH